jgi:hypothetical protein
MTVSTVYQPLVYNGNGVTTSFAVTWPFFTGSLIVTSISSTGVETVKTLGTDYTVSGGTTKSGLPNTGTVVMKTAAIPAAGTQLRITRSTPVTQVTTWGENDAFPQAVVESALDKNILIAQEIASKDWTGPQGPQGPAGPKGQDGMGTGDVVGPSSSTNNNLAVFDGTTGKLIKDSGVAITVIEEILSEIHFASVAAVAAYNPVVAPNFVRTSGYASAGDGGGALYKQVGSEPSHPGKVQSADGTWWEIAEPVLRPAMVGLLGDGSDETVLLEDFISMASDRRAPIEWDGRTYGFTNIGVGKANGYFDWRGSAKFVQLSGRTASSPALQIGGTVSNTVDIVATADAGSRVLQLSDASNVAVGDLLDVKSTRLLPGDHRFDGNNSFGQLVKVVGVSGDNVTLADPLKFGIQVATLATGTAQAGASGTITLAAGETATEKDIKNALLTITGGTGSGQTKWVHEYNSSTKVLGIGTAYTGFPQSDWSTTPDNTSTYSIGVTATARIVKPAAVKVDGSFSVKGYAASGVVVYGVSIFGAHKPDIEGLTVEDCSNNGVYIQICYEPNLRGCRSDRANYATSGGGGLGYGFFLITCWNAILDGCVAAQCRTGFDEINRTHNTTRTNCVFYGGGTTYDGGDFFPATSGVGNSGFSSHTGASGSHTIGCTVVDAYFSGKQRGMNERVTACIHRGAGAVGWQPSYTNYVEYSRLSYDDGWTYWPTKDDDGDDGWFVPASGYAAERAHCLVNPRHSTLHPLATIVVDGCVAKAVTQSLVHISDQTTTESLAINLVVTNNKFAVIAESGASTLHVIDASSNLAVRSITAYGNHQFVGGSTLGSIIADNARRYRILDRISNTGLLLNFGERKWVVIIDDDSVVSIPVGQDCSAALLQVYEQTGAITNRYCGLVTLGSATSLADLHASGVGLYTSSLTGTTGTDGQINVSLRSSDGQVIIENRTGAKRRIIVELGGML